MKKSIVKIIVLVLLLMNCTIIFLFSSQNARESGNLSSKVARMVKQETEKVTEEKKGVEKIEKVIRKIAHFLIYTSLGFWLMVFMTTYAMGIKKRVCVSLGAGVLYAISDEIHQAFVPGRACLITDVILDSMGILFGIVMVFMLLEICKKIKNK